MENKCLTIPTQVRWLVNPCMIRERKQKGDIATLSIFIALSGSEVAQGLVENGIKMAGLRYGVEIYKHKGPDIRCKLYCGCGHIENQCGSMPTCGYCLGHHRTSNQKCNKVVCRAKQRSLCSHMLSKCPMCQVYHIVFSNRCVKKSEATKGVRQSRKIGLAGRA